MEIKDFSEELNAKIEVIKRKILSGEIALLDLELVPFFQQLKDSLSVFNINSYSKTYAEACGLLNQKFDELKRLLNSIDNEKKFFEYLNNAPDDAEIAGLFDNCWLKNFDINALSLDFLESCKEKLCFDREGPLTIEHLKRVESDEEFLLEVPTKKFSERMLSFFTSVREKLPCSFEDLFEDELEQLKIYENFVFTLHLLQSGKLKYQKETNTLYTDDIS